MVRARPVPSPLGQDASGLLRFRAGFELSTRHLPFGGFSGLVVEKDRLLAVSDQGFAWQGRTLFDSEGTLLGFSDSHLGPLHNSLGVAATREHRFDSEEVSSWDNGWLVSFEGEHQILHYRRRSPFAFSDQTPSPVQLPASTAQLEENGGIEAMTRLKDGRLLLIAEKAAVGQEELAAPLPAWLGEPRTGESRTGESRTGDPSAPAEWHSLTLERTGEFHPTSAAHLPSGDVLLLERSWNERDGVRARLSILRFDDLAPGAHITPAELWRFEDPQTIDNFEAIYVSGGADEPLFLYLLTDDNFSESQRTLLFQLEILASL